LQWAILIAPSHKRTGISEAPQNSSFFRVVACLWLTYIWVRRGKLIWAKDMW
jgi:hypothetical protein